MNNIKARSFYWNTLSGIISAGQSAIVLILLSNFMTKTDAGIYSIAIAIGNIVSIFSKYGIRNFQVTDVEEKFSFNQYFTTRVITILSSIFLTATYLIYQYSFGHYSINKLLIILFICLLYTIESLEDVFYGMYQQKGRLDIGAKCFSLRLIISTLFICTFILLKFSLLLSAVASFLVSLFFAFYFIHNTINHFKVNKIRFKFYNSINLLIICFPLALATTLSIYIGNSPKYFIDIYLDDSTQAIFSYLMMPAFTIMVVNQFIYQPIIRDLGELWFKCNRKAFEKKVLKQYLVVTIITLLVIIFGAVLGIPFLSFLYNAELDNYRLDFIILLLGGGFFALANFLMVPITIMRQQKLLAYGFVLISIISFIAGVFLIPRFGIRGAASLYLLLNAVLSVYLTIAFFAKCKNLPKSLNY